MLNAKRPRMIMAMIPTISITISLVVHAVDSPLVGLQFFRDRMGWPEHAVADGMEV